ncbi:MAG: GNAT family N-acetyltransferase [Verrucomicrobiota bacterium]|nr:GNAT family N-acetyltransferase [Verrucomicrobiota bacterium]
MQLTLSKSVIRGFRPEDAPSIVRHIGAYSVARNLSVVPHPYVMQDAEEWIAGATARQPETQFAITIDDAVVGGIGVGLLDPQRKAATRCTAELGYWLGESFWGRGIMTEAVTAFTGWAFRNLDLVRIQAGVFARNLASARVLTKTGFDLEGRLSAYYCKEGEFIDGLLFAKVRLPA